jgi:hypothetical protein
MPVDADLTDAIRAAIVGSSCALQLATYLGAPAVFTRTPVPGNATYPLVTISRNTSSADEDGTNDRRPLLSYSISVYGSNQSIPAFPYRTVSGIAYCLRTLFHRQRNLALGEWGITDQRCIGPVDQSSVGQITTRVVTLNVRIAQLAGV